MNGRPVTDAQISQALRAHLPARAQAGLRERILATAETTNQQRALPSFLGALSEADPVTRRRNVLIAAALLVALAFASAAAVGAFRLLERDPIDELSLEPPADVPAFVLSSHELVTQLPPLALTWHDSGSLTGTDFGHGYGAARGRIYVDRSGAVRFDRFASADATEPSSSSILSANHRISGVAAVGSEAVWVEQGHEALGDDPRVFIRTVLRAEDGPPGCEWDPSEVGNGAAAAGWRYVGLEYVAGRPTHHVACASDLWIDVETRLILRSQGPAVDDAGQPIPGQFETTEVTEIAFGEQPAALFEPPDGLARISAEEYSAYRCPGDLPNEIFPGISDCPSEEAEATPQPEPEPSPTPTARPDTSECAVPPGDLSEPTGPLAWNPKSLKGDWPAPVRPEPAGDGSVLPMPLTYLDPMGDNGSDAYPCVDIRGVMADTSEVLLKLVSNQPPVVDPAEQWIAYGVVTDDDRDGVPDWRFGFDNTFAETCDDMRGGGWRTNLHTGQTDAGCEQPYPPNLNGGGFAGAYRSGSDAGFGFSGAHETAGQGLQRWGFELDMPFYTWASVIVNGRVVATDYAPDSGWLVATRGATPGGTLLLGDPLPNLSMTVPDGWTGNEGPEGLRRGKCDGIGPCAVVRFEVIDGPEDLCSGAIKPPLGPSFDDLMTYFAGLPIIEISESADVTLDGLRGKHLQVRFSTRLRELADENRPGEMNPALYASVVSDLGCAAGPIAEMLVGVLMEEGHISVWILDVDGVHLLISSESDTAEIRQIVESIHFER